MNTLVGRRAEVYRNVRKQCYSLRVAGRVVAHATSLELAGCEFRVSAADRRRVLREGVKNVHAVVVGAVVALEGVCPSTCGIRVRYNPRETETFVAAETSTPVFRARRAFLGDGGRVMIEEVP